MLKMKIQYNRIQEFRKCRNDTYSKINNNKHMLIIRESCRIKKVSTLSGEFLEVLSFSDGNWKRSP